MRHLLIALLALLALTGCETSSPPPAAQAVAACPADVSEADRYKYPACSAECPADVSEADRYKFPACNQ